MTKFYGEREDTGETEKIWGESGHEGERGHGSEAEKYYGIDKGNGVERSVFKPGSVTIKKPSGLVCTHCGEMGHSKQRCYEIIGYP